MNQFFFFFKFPLAFPQVPMKCLFLSWLEVLFLKSGSQKTIQIPTEYFDTAVSATTVSSPNPEAHTGLIGFFELGEFSFLGVWFQMTRHDLSYGFCQAEDSWPNQTRKLTGLESPDLPNMQAKRVPVSGCRELSRTNRLLRIREGSCTTTETHHHRKH